MEVFRCGGVGRQLGHWIDHVSEMNDEGRLALIDLREHMPRARISQGVGGVWRGGNILEFVDVGVRDERDLEQNAASRTFAHSRVSLVMSLKRGNLQRANLPVNRWSKSIFCLVTDSFRSG